MTWTCWNLRIHIISVYIHRYAYVHLLSSKGPNLGIQLSRPSGTIAYDFMPHRYPQNSGTLISIQPNRCFSIHQRSACTRSPCLCRVSGDNFHTVSKRHTPSTLICHPKTNRYLALVVKPTTCLNIPQLCDSCPYVVNLDR